MPEYWRGPENVEHSFRGPENHAASLNLKLITPRKVSPRARPFGRPWLIIKYMTRGLYQEAINNAELLGNTWWAKTKKLKSK